MAAPTIIKASNVTQSFTVGQEPVIAVQKTSFTIAENSFNIVFGPSGSGKSTLLNIIAGIQTPTSGIVEVGGKNLYKLSADKLAEFRSSNIGFIYQSNHWVSSLSVVENVALPLLLSGHSRETAEKIALTCLRRVNMENFASRNPLLLSGGEQQRVSVARAIVNTPFLIIADEPTGNLDSANSDKVIRLLQEYQREHHCTVVLVTHNLEHLVLSDSILHSDNGVITQLNGSSGIKIANQLLNDLKHRLVTNSGKVRVDS